MFSSERVDAVSSRRLMMLARAALFDLHELIEDVFHEQGEQQQFSIQILQQSALSH